MQAPIAILLVCVYGRPGFTGREKDIGAGAGTDTDFIGACTPALTHAVAVFGFVIIGIQSPKVCRSSFLTYV
jgi:hypothetical protein